MTMRLAPEPHIRKHLLYFLLHAAGFAAVFALLFVFVERGLPETGVWRSVPAGLPGAMLGLWLYVLYAYLRHYDELMRSLMLKALAFSALVGIVTLFTSMVRAKIGGYAQFDDATIVATMASAWVLAALFFKWRHR